MQTFLPYADFTRSAACLDDRRLGKQRVEALTLLRGKWPNHPASKMWRGYGQALALYGMLVCDEWKRRGFRDSCGSEFEDHLWRHQFQDMKWPTWLGNPAFHLAHQSNLVRKNPAHYRKYFPDVPDNLPYIWPKGEE